MMRWWMACLVSGQLLFGAMAMAQGPLAADRQGETVVVSGDHFRLTIDGRRGGQITEVRLFDGSLWNALLGGDGQSCPAIRLSDAATDFRLDAASDGRIEKFEAAADMVHVVAVALPRSAEGQVSPWTVRLDYEIYAEGAVFVTMSFRLPKGETVLRDAEIGVKADRAVVEAAKYRQQTFTHEQLSGSFKGKGLPTGRIAFGVNPRCSFTNEVQAIVEDKTGLSGEAGCTVERGEFRWRLAAESRTIKGPFEYANRLALGFGSAATGKPKTNLLAQRVYHWINWIKYEEVFGAAWYPTDEQIDRMVANGATMLILHEHWMDQQGSNGHPHANYVPRDEDAFRHMIACAHQKGLHVGVYNRGIERYSVATGFFRKYLKRDWDGLYTDWSGAFDISRHENERKPETLLGDSHLTADGMYTPAREWFLYTKKQREMVGPKGFLVNHQGFGTTGILANLVVDGYLPGESPRDYEMFRDVDDAIYQGMLGGTVCMPWTVDAPQYITPEGVAKMAAWGFYPQAGIAFQRPALGKQPAKTLFPADPDAAANAFVLPYWRVLRTVDAERCTVYNSPAVNRIAATSSDPRIACLIYRQEGETPGEEVYLVVAVNLGDQPSSATITLEPDVLGMRGTYQAARVDSMTGAITPLGEVSAALTTGELAPLQIEGVRLTRATMAGK